jgi:hypothetical protein
MSLPHARGELTCANALENALDLAELQEARDTADGTITLDELFNE